MQYVVTRMIDAYVECADLIRKNYEESGDGGEFEVTDSIYRKVDRKGAGFAVIVRDGSKPIAYASVLLFHRPHKPSDFIATNDTIYVLPEYRHGSIPGRLFLLCERIAKKAGAEFFAWDVPSGSPLEQALKKREMYSRSWAIYERRL